MPGCAFLDLFAGTGNIGIEALSRGAGSAVFVERDQKNVKIIKENLTITGLGDKARLIHQDVARALPLLAGHGQTFDLVFMDPPYLKGLEASTLDGIVGSGLLKTGGSAIVESSSKEYLPREIKSLKLIRQEKYGDTLLSFYINEQVAGEGN